MRTFEAVVKEVTPGEEGVVVALVSTPAEDRVGDVVEPKGVVLGPHVPVLWAHDQRTPAVGVVRRVEARDNGVLAELQLDLEDLLGREIHRKLRLGILRAFSIGFRPIEYERTNQGYRYTKWELLEVSVVNVPANPEATALAVRELKGPQWRVVPFQNLPLDMDRSWDAAAARRRVAKWASSDGSGDKDKVDWAKYRKAFCVYDASAPDNFGSYKFPIADVVDGKLTAIWRGVVAAMAILLGARGGTNLPDDVRKGIYNHLAKYYKKADKEPPEFRSYDIFGDFPLQDLEDLDALLEGLLGAESTPEAEALYQTEEVSL